LEHYLKTGKRMALLRVEPLGWGNVKSLLQTAPGTMDRKGCFSVNSVRELAHLPKEARRMVKESREQLKQLIKVNCEAENSKTDAGALTDMIAIFFSGICVEANLDQDNTRVRQKIDSFVDTLRSL
jgi:TetR/AcrR family transcriptional regulator, copper-responsive repressor